MKKQTLITQNGIKTLFAVLSPLFFYAAFSNLFADDAENYLKDAFEQYSYHHDEKAVQNLRWVLQLNPNDWKAHQLMGYCAYRMGDNESALVECQRSLQLHRDNPRLELFAKRLKAKAAGQMSPNDTGAYFEGSIEAQMPAPPDREGVPPQPTSGFPKTALTVTKLPKGKESFFIKTSCGTFFAQTFLTLHSYNGPVSNGMPSEVDTTKVVNQIGGFTASGEIGVDCPDDFSFSAGME